MKIEYQDGNKASFSGDLPNLPRSPFRGNNPSLEGKSCRVILGMRYHFTVGGWVTNGPATWDPDKEIGELWLSEMPGDEKAEVIEARKIRLGHFAPQPPLNAERDAMTFLQVKRLSVKTSVIGLSCFAETFALPDLFGRGPLLYYIAGNAKIYIDGRLVVDKRYISSGGTSIRMDTWEINRRGG